MIEPMIPYWWWDALAFIGAACAIVLLMTVTWFLFCEVQNRRTFNREMREFNQKMEAVSRIWRQDRE